MRVLRNKRCSFEQAWVPGAHLSSHTRPCSHSVQSAPGWVELLVWDRVCSTYYVHNPSSVAINRKLLHACATIRPPVMSPQPSHHQTGRLDAWQSHTEATSRQCNHHQSQLYTEELTSESLAVLDINISQGKTCHCQNCCHRYSLSQSLPCHRCRVPSRLLPNHH